MKSSKARDQVKGKQGQIKRKAPEKGRSTPAHLSKGADGFRAKDNQVSPDLQQVDVGRVAVQERLEAHSVSFEDMTKAMLYLTNEVARLRYRLLQHEPTQ